METVLLILSTAISSMIFMRILIPIFKRIAFRLNLYDKPNHRKIHNLPIPQIGGVSIAFSIFLSILVNPMLLKSWATIAPLIISAFVLLIIGLLDDRFDLKASHKLAIQILCAFSISYSGIRIFSLYGMFGIYEIPVYAQYLITILIVTGVVNAFNLMDGVDGLLGVITIIGFLVLFICSIYLGQYFLSGFYFALIGAIVVFLKHNFMKEKIFMGDAGSLFLGHILIGSTIFLLKNTSFSNFSHQLILYSFVGFFSVPVLDSIRVYMGRIKKGHSPFKADKTHLHHLLLNMGFTHKKIAIIVGLLSIIFVAISLLFFKYINFGAIILLIIIVFSGISIVLNLNRQVSEWQVKLKELESKTRHYNPSIHN